ncbi:hypothetical protein DV451_003079 [Geotrichum candidum]|uniref:rRNA methyltransferase 2, mitochondrial n=1 Tax=Geotrichum candidum TaxID=1173061 RepID=A0A9P5KSW8_GEOCN|nr:hypothetical protein DV451_003079 [Geotrichum candidum]KAF5110815.1 hypothetical protein DV453_000516 [Geotrichum candidum]
MASVYISRVGFTHTPLTCRLQPVFTFLRHKSSASSKRWNARQHRDKYAIEARVEGYKSRAAYKLIELDTKYRLFRPNQTVVDLGFAPGSWTQVAVEKTKPDGRVVGLDILPCRPPPGASAIQGNFLSAGVQEELKRMLIAGVGKRVKKHVFADEEPSQPPTDDVESYIDMERHQTELEDQQSTAPAATISNNAEFPVDLILTLMFALDTLKPNGKFVCKFYTGVEDKHLEARLKRTFKHVFREKPNSSRSESREMYFVATGRVREATKKSVFGIA